MSDVTLARALHVLAVVHWIGGVALVTLVLLPAITRQAAPAARLPLPLFLHAWFHRRAQQEPEAAVALVQRAHFVLLAASAVAVAAAVLGAHGFLY